MKKKEMMRRYEELQINYYKAVEELRDAYRLLEDAYSFLEIVDNNITLQNRVFELQGERACIGSPK